MPSGKAINNFKKPPISTSFTIFTTHPRPVHKKNRKLFNNRPYIDFESWLRIISTKKTLFENILSYPNKIKMATEILEKENTGVFLYEDLTAAPNSFYSNIASFLEINRAEALSLSKETHFNKRLLKSEVDYIRNIDKSFLKRYLWQRKTTCTEIRKQELSKSSGNCKTPASADLTEPWARKISGKTRDENRWLMDEFKLNLNSYNYPL